MAHDPQAQIDRFMARLGSLDAQERVVRRRVLAVIEQQAIAAEASVLAPPISAGPPMTLPAGSRRSKGASETTLHAISAIAAVVHTEGVPKGGALGLTKKAAELAQTLDLPGANALNPESSSMRAIAAAFIAGIQAAQKVP